jgi:general secretion pathway protein K
VIRQWIIKHVLKFIVKSILRWLSNRCEPKAADGSNAGFVLIAIIWIAGLLAVSATAFIATTTAQIFLARNVSEGMRLDSAASGVARLVAYRLASQEALSASSLQGLACQWNKDIEVLFRVQDQGGLVDLNTSSPDLLMALLNAMTGDLQKSRDIYQAIQDFKDPDKESMQGGVEPERYSGKVYGPKNAPFETPLELDQIPEISDALFLRIQTFVTVQSQQSGIDLAVAPENLKKMLESGLQSNADVQLFNQPSPSRIFTIDAVAYRKSGGVFQRRTMVNILRQPERPFATLEWRRASTIQRPSPASKAITPCFNGQFATILHQE